MNVGQLYTLKNNDLAIPKFVGTSHIVYDVWINQGDSLNLAKYTRTNADLESVKTLEEFKNLIVVTTNLIDTNYTMDTE